MRKLFLAFLPAVLFAACGHDHDHTAAANTHAIHGDWTQDTGSAAKGIGLTFYSDGTKVGLHTVPRADGSHDHLYGTYTFDAATKALTINKLKLLGDDKADAWTGTVGTDRIELSAGADKVVCKRGSAH